MGNIFLDNMGFWLVVCIIALFGLMLAASNEEANNRNAFMAQCTQDHKQYECQVMWGQTRESHQTSDMARSVAIGAAAGAIAGSRGR